MTREKRVERRTPGGGKTVSVPEYTGWYFFRGRDRWERYGPYDSTAAGQITGSFKADTGKEPAPGDRIFVDGTLMELIKGAPPKVIARGVDAEDEIERMMRRR